ncbi:hypothetical protein [Salinifilum aidingensis]
MESLIASVAAECAVGGGSLPAASGPGQAGPSGGGVAVVAVFVGGEGVDAGGDLAVGVGLAVRRVDGVDEVAEQGGERWQRVSVRPGLFGGRGGHRSRVVNT